MKTTNKGKLALAIDENGNRQVIFEPVNGTVWLHKSELPSLFGVTIQVIHASLDAMIKSRIVDVERTCKYDLAISGNRIRYDVREMNLEAIIAMAFRIDSRPAKALREWFTRRCLHPGISISLPDIEQQAGLN
ncbi:hypothetical protein FACS1894169_09390 [Bacteroidia bacterium]|nr:hypothetical protein FACS1894169_09390 [Bacteroidia bacterium]